MIGGYEVTSAGFDFLKQYNLLFRIDNRWKDIREKIPLSVLYKDEFDEIYNGLMKSNINKSRKKALEQVSKNQSTFSLAEDLLVASGEITDMILTPEEKTNYRQFGIEALSQLDGTIASYCLGKYDTDILGRRIKYNWRNSKHKTTISGCTHGDLQIYQIDVIPKINKDTIDGTETVQLSGKLPACGINADYNYWLHLAAIAMKYADTVNIEVPEIKNWRKLMEKYGWDGKIVSSDSGGIGFGSFPYEYSESVMAQKPDKLETMKLKKSFFGRLCPNANHTTWWYPIIDEEDNLLFCINRPAKEPGKTITLENYMSVEEYLPTLKFSKYDALHLFKGAVNGIMTGQSRTNPAYLACMMWEYDQLKEGKSVEAIREESLKFDKRWE